MGAIALTNIGHGFVDFNSIYRMDLDRKEARHQQWMARGATPQEDMLMKAIAERGRYESLPIFWTEYTHRGE